MKPVVDLFNIRLVSVEADCPGGNYLQLRQQAGQTDDCGGPSQGVTYWPKSKRARLAQYHSDSHPCPDPHPYHHDPAAGQETGSLPVQGSKKQVTLTGVVVYGLST